MIHKVKSYKEVSLIGDRETFKFEHRGCTLVIGATNTEAGWLVHFHLKSRSVMKEATLWGVEGPFPSVQEAVDKASHWAIRKIQERTGSCQRNTWNTRTKGRILKTSSDNTELKT